MNRRIVINNQPMIGGKLADDLYQELNGLVCALVAGLFAIP